MGAGCVLHDTYCKHPPPLYGNNKNSASVLLLAHLSACAIISLSRSLYEAGIMEMWSNSVNIIVQFSSLQEFDDCQQGYHRTIYGSSK